MLKQFCDDFASFSGLRSNADKTTLLFCGQENNVVNDIADIGFNIDDHFILLGMKINKGLGSLTTYFDEIIVKLQQIAEYWTRFRLTLPGRISVCKTFMLSQIGYLGSIISPTPGQLKRMQEILDNFCLSTMRVAKKKLYTPANEGGLGLINLGNYITALQCAWVKRTTQHWCDNWRYDLKLAGYGNPLTVNKNCFDKTLNPILFNICESFGKFAEAFYKKDKNYSKAYIFNNPIITRGRNDAGLLCSNFFGQGYSFVDKTKIAKLKFEDFFTRGGAKIFGHPHCRY